MKLLITKVLSSYGPFAYFSDIFISGKNVVFSAHNLNGLYILLKFQPTIDKWTCCSNADFLALYLTHEENMHSSGFCLEEYSKFLNK